jgi:ABC-2 type transport system ATP-binding protein
MNESVISTRGLTKYYGKRCVVDMLDLDVPRGSVFGFLGRNGSGKTTTIRMLLGLVEPTRGSATVLGYDSTRLPPAARARIGYLTESHPVYGWMSVAEHGRFQRSFYATWNDEIFAAVIAHFRLDPKAKAKDLSRGQRAGLCLAMTLAPEPELIVLDDPALGLDPVARHHLLEAMVYVTRKAGRTVFFSSHIIADVERVADRIAVMDRGVLRACCPVEMFRNRVRRFILSYEESPPRMSAHLPGILQVRRSERALAITLVWDAEGDATLAALRPARIQEVALALEDSFIDYVSERGQRETSLLGLGATP